MTLPEFLAKLAHVMRSRDGYTAACPGHEDNSRDSLSIREGETEAILAHCFAGCTVEHVVQAMGLEMRDLFPAPDDRPRGKRTAAASPNDGMGLTLQAYADAKGLPVAALKGWGVVERTSPYPPYKRCLEMPFTDEDGAVVSVLYRLSLTGERRMRWRQGDHHVPYGLSRLKDARILGTLVLVEGPSDTQTLWHRGIPALGLPSNCWKDEWAAHLDEFETIYVVIEPGASGEGMLKSLAKSRIRDRVRLLSPAPYKDPSAMHIAKPEAFDVVWALAIKAATPWAEHEAAERRAREAAAWAICAPLACAPRILARLHGALRALGVVGERRARALLFLAATSRLLEKPVSVAVKGPSAAGKSHLVDRVLSLFPASATYALSAMSERALAYSEEPLAHRMLILYEAAGLRSDFASYLVRSLLSEGRLRYETVEKTKAGLRPRLIEREGPTGLLVTTTLLRLHPENETRLLSVTVTDSSEQTAAVLAALAHDGRPAVDLAAWHALQDWLADGECRVVIPYAPELVRRIPPVAVRLRRDVGQVLELVRAHVLLHRATRRVDTAGRIIATLADYAAIRRLVEPLVAAGVGATVPASVRKTVAAVEACGGEDVTVRAVAQHLKLDKSAASRRVQRAVDDGYLVNREDHKGRPARLALGEPLPADAPVLPRPRDLLREGGSLPPRERVQPCNPAESGQEAGGGCTVADVRGGIEHPSFPKIEAALAAPGGRRVLAGIDAELDGNDRVPGEEG